ALIGLACQYVLVPGLYLPFEQIYPSLSHQLARPAEQNVGGGHGVVAGVVLVAFLAVGAPLVEELFFRGLLLRALLGRTRAPVAMVLSALLFAMAHFEAVQFAGLALFGCVLGYLACRTGRLGPGMAAHAAFNAAAVVTLLLR
ncbi:MAG: lysostaphin resistance A-like protein, partial [Acidimicrobiales bacterium]